MKINTFSLSNGLRVVHGAVNSSRIAHCGIIINAGSRDELETQHGLAHYIEHTIFKGTRKRKAYHILNRLDAVGGELDAYTTKEDMCIYASFLDHHLGRAVELLSDIVFNATYPSHEIEKEKSVIIEEIKSYLDSPAEQIFDDFESMLFRNHPMGRSILGTEQHVRSFDKKTIRQFTHLCFRPENMVLSVVGNIPFNKVKKLAEKYFVAPMGNNGAIIRTPITHFEKQRVIMRKKVFQTHCMIGGPAYNVHDKRRRVLIMLNNLLGGPGLNSRLNLNIREKYGCAYNLESAYSPYSDCGHFSIYLGTDHKSINRVVKLVFNELGKLKNKRLGTLQIHHAKEQLKGQIALSQENRSNLMISIGKSLLSYGKVDPIEQIYKKIDAITSSHILEVANETFQKDQLSTIMFQPE